MVSPPPKPKGAPPPPKTKAAPPPPMTGGSAGDDEPRRVVPYEVPALILDSKEGEEGDDEVVEIEPTQEWSVDEVPRSLPPPSRLPPPGGLPRPGGLSPGAPLGLASEDSALDELSDPHLVADLDPAELVEDIASEFVEPPVATPAAPVVQPTPVGPSAAGKRAPDRRVRWALYFLGGAALLSLIVAVLPSGSDDDADTGEGEPETGLLAEAEPQAQVEVKTEPAPEVAPEVEAAAEQEPEPEVEPEVEPEPELKPEPEPEPLSVLTAEPSPPAQVGGPGDKRSASELYAAAKTALERGQAEEAYRLAFVSWRRKKSSEAAELMTTAACQMQDPARAARSIAKVGRAQREALESACLSSGVDLSAE